MSSFSWSWERSSGKGQVFSWTVIHRALHPGFAPDVPYATVVIELAEGVRMVSHVLDLTPEQLEQVLKLTERYCVVYQTLRSAPPVSITLAQTAE